MAAKSLASRIQEAREARGFSASDLARLVGVSPTAVWNWEKNGSKPRSDTLAAIAKALATTPDFLLTGSAQGTASATGTVADIIDQAESQIAIANGVARKRVKIHVELLPA